MKPGQIVCIILLALTLTLNIANAADILSGEPTIVKVLNSESSLVANSFYIFWHDSSTGYDHTKSLSFINDGITTVFNNQISLGVVNLKGIRYQIYANTPGKDSKCLYRNNACAAKIVGNLFDSGFNNLRKSEDKLVPLFVANIDNLISYMKAPSTANTAVCSSKTSVLLTYVNQRSLADNMKWASRLLPYLYRRSDYDSLRAAILRADSHLRLTSPISYINSTYATCYGLSEGQTLYQIVSGLNEVEKNIPDYSRREYVKSAFTMYISTFASTFQNAWITLGLPTPNGFGQYLSFASISQKFGLDSLQAGLTAHGIVNLFSQQALITADQTACAVKTAIQVYGGWYHDVSSDCAQKMGYHGFIVDGLLELDSYLKVSGLCGNAYWSFTCANLEYNLMAALAWILNAQDTQWGFFYDIAPSSAGPYDLPSQWGTSVGVMLGARILDFLQHTRGYSDSALLKVGYDGQSLTIAQARAKLAYGVDYMIRDGESMGSYHLGDLMDYLVTKKIKAIQ